MDKIKNEYIRGNSGVTNVIGKWDRLDLDGLIMLREEIMTI